MTYLYRVEKIFKPNIFSLPAYEIEMREYSILSETPKGYWIGPSWCKKWVSKTAKKRYAYPTKEEALNNFILRTSKYVKILKATLNRNEHFLFLAKKLEEDGLPIESTPEFKSLSSL